LGTSNLSTDRAKNLRRLAELMNTRHKIPFPITKQLLSCFDIALTSAEVDFLVRLGTEPYTFETAASMSPLPGGPFELFFEGLVRKGFIWPHETAEGEEQYVLPGIMLGWFEVYLSGGEETPERREFARRLDLFIRSFGKMSSFPLRKLINHRIRRSEPYQSILAPGNIPERGKGKTIPVNRSVDSEPARVYPARTVKELIERHGDGESIAVVHCFCRQYHKMMEQPCRFEHPAQSCIGLGSLSRYAVKHGVGRFVSKSEALELVRNLQSRGAIHLVFHKDEDMHNPEIAICNCCWDCCGILGSYSRGILPLNFHSFFEARLPDLSLCSGCATCEDFCPVQAISVANDKCAINPQNCIGCGQCQLHCPEGAIQLVTNERRVFLPLKKKSEARIRD
jgi:ferredoxin